MERSHISPILNQRLTKFFTLTLDKNNDGLINWNDFEAAIENIISKEESTKNSRLKILRMGLEQNYQKYFSDLCKLADANGDGDVDLEEWLDIMNNIIKYLKENDSFPEWFEGLYKALFRSNDFFDIKNVEKEEFINMMLTWEIDEEAAEKAFDFITKNGQEKLDYSLFSKLMKMFFSENSTEHPINLGL